MDNEKIDIYEIIQELELFDIRVERKKYNKLIYLLKLYLQSLRRMDFEYYQE